MTGRVDPDKVDAEHLSAELADFSGYRVGRYFERLVLYWLQHLRRVEIVAQSLPVRKGKRTIGEIDLLFRDEQGRLTHWELAVKFYLYVPQVRALNSHYLGPNVRDTFERKMQRLFDVQLPRSKRDFPDVDVRQAFVKGRIFYHPRDVAPANTPRHLSPDHLRCEWIRAAEVAALDRDDDVFYRLVDKPFWLSEQLAGQSDSDLLSHEELAELLREHFASRDRCVLVSQLEPSPDCDPMFVESQRMFVVPNHWPAELVS
ncbi:hypothetical protein UC8_11450 [Roseimaritima ulvae]|uniref:DUF1853 domain-containing protein n=2 Tax=Roseimaritima ulvae TaxID=980254 RepID=A0A5B9QJS6_9BACT|nr:hypothetical protein UC8_11450 [Roseimaritima ulvae]